MSVSQFRKVPLIRKHYAWTYKRLHVFNSRFERDLWIYQNQGNYAWISKTSAKEANEYLRTRKESCFKTIAHAEVA